MEHILVQQIGGLVEALRSACRICVSLEEYQIEVTMYLSQKYIPFTTDKAYGGFADIDGMLQVERDRLVLEYQVKDGILGVLKSSPQDLVIPYDELSTVEFKSGWFSASLRLKIRNLHKLSQFPAGKDGMITLKIKRRDRELADDMEAYINLRIAEVGLEKLEGNGV